jgi:hypothetical protein
MYTRNSDAFPVNPPLAFLFALSCPSCMNQPFFLLTWRSALLLMVRIPIHSCPWLAINCFPLAASPTPRHPTDQVTYLYRRHQQHQPSHLIQFPITPFEKGLGFYILNHCSKINLPLPKVVWCSKCWQRKMLMFDIFLQAKIMI